MNKLSLVLMNDNIFNEYPILTNCDIHTDYSIDKNLNYFERLNRIGNTIRSIEIERDCKYDLIYLLNLEKYSLNKIELDFFDKHFKDIITKDSQIYSAEVLHGTFPSECKLTSNMMYMESVPFNFISNFCRFYSTFNKNLKSKSFDNMMYIYTYMCKIKSYNIDKSFTTTFLKKLI
jgi:hypothetical protein